MNSWTRWPQGLATFAAAFAPRPVTYRTMDFRTNEFPTCAAAIGSSPRRRTR